MSSDYILSVFITILTIVDPIGLIPIYLPLAQRFSRKDQRRLILKSSLWAVLISIGFLAMGNFLFHYLDINFNSLYIVGGILLFKTGLEMVFSIPRRKEEHLDESEKLEETQEKSIAELAIYPLAIPMLSGPGTIASIVMFSNRYNTWTNDLIILLAILLAFFVTAITMFFSGHIVKWIGQSGLNVLDRVMGIILCSLAVQFIINAAGQIYKGWQT
jgi:multiple antibiotic resistance protein